MHWQNLINFGILPLVFKNKEDWDKIDINDILVIENVREGILKSKKLEVVNKTKNQTYKNNLLSDRQIKAMLAGSLINLKSKF